MATFDRHRTDLAALRARDRLRVLKPRQGADFSSNDYLGLANSPLLRAGVAAALARGVPVGSGGSRLLRGNCDEHEALEYEAAMVFGSETALFFASGFAAITAVIAVDRLGKGLRTAPRDALITVSSDETNLGRSFGVHRMLDTVGAALGPLLAFVILYFLPTGYHLIFLVSLACATVGVILLGLLVPGRRPRRERALAGEPVLPFRWRTLTDPRLRRLVLAAGIFAVLTVGDGFIYLVLQARSPFAAVWFPLLYVGTNVAFFVFAVPFGRLADRFGRAKMFVLGHCALLAAYACAALPIGGAAITIVCLVLLGAFYAATDGVLAALAGEFTPKDSTASGIAMAQTVVALGRLLGSTGFGVLWFAVGSQAAVTIVGVALAVAIPAVLVAMRPLVSDRLRT